jgi:hypothetical protein
VRNGEDLEPRVEASNFEQPVRVAKELFGGWAQDKPHRSDCLLDIGGRCTRRHRKGHRLGTRPHAIVWAGNNSIVVHYAKAAAHDGCTRISSVHLDGTCAVLSCRADPGRGRPRTTAEKVLLDHLEKVILIVFVFRVTGIVGAGAGIAAASLGIVVAADGLVYRVRWQLDRRWLLAFSANGVVPVDNNKIP